MGTAGVLDGGDNSGARDNSRYLEKVKWMPPPNQGLDAEGEEEGSRTSF